MLMIPNEIFNVGSEMKDLGETPTHNDINDSNLVTRLDKDSVLGSTSPLYPLPTIFKNTTILLQEFESKRSPWTQESIRWMRHISSLVTENIVELQREDFITDVVTQKKDYQRKMNLNTFLESLPQRQGQWQVENESTEDLALVEGDLHVESMQSPVTAKFKSEEEGKAGNNLASTITLLLVEAEQLRLVGSAEFCAAVATMPVAFDVPVVSAAATVANICSMRSILQHVNSSITRLQLPSLVSTSYREALARTDKLILDLMERISESIRHFHEISTTDNVLRQDWAATSSYMRDKKITPGVVALASSIRGVFHAFLSQQPLWKANDGGQGSCLALLAVDVALNSLLHGCLSMTRLYHQVLNPSRVRLLQWQRDLTYWIHSTKELVLWIVSFLPTISRKEDGAVGDGLWLALTETTDFLLGELAAILQYLVAVLYLSSDSSDSFLIVIRAIVSQARTLSGTLPNEQNGGNSNLPAIESLLNIFSAFASDVEESTPSSIEAQALSSISVFDRLADILFGLGLTTVHTDSSFDASVVASAWKRITTTKVVDPLNNSWLSTYIPSQDCLHVFSLLSDFDGSDIADATTRSRVLLRGLLQHCIQRRPEGTNCSYPPLTAEQVARKESLDLLLKEMQS